ncbi:MULTISPECIES: SRPBCC domain-containing protein [unclassified Streptomyces]|uniref:SRPBCC family protein n=1 Tax=unclassified Streptomyces TaxID=2593676 RepID=UPI00380B6BF6
MPKGLTQDAGWQIGVSATLPFPRSVVWEFMVSPEGIELWLGEGAELPPAPTKGTTFETVDGVTGEIRSYRPLDRIRATRGTTTVQLAVSSSGDRSVLRFHQEHLASAEEREQQRAHWQGVMERVTKELS